MKQSDGQRCANEDLCENTGKHRNRFRLAGLTAPLAEAIKTILNTAHERPHRRRVSDNLFGHGFEEPLRIEVPVAAEMGLKSP